MINMIFSIDLYIRKSLIYTVNCLTMWSGQNKETRDELSINNTRRNKMKTVEKRRQITHLINTGEIKEVGSVSSRSKVIRNLNSEQCDNVIENGSINYSDYPTIIEREDIYVSNSIPNDDDSDGDDGGANGANTEEDGDSDQEQDSENTDEPSREIPEDAMQNLASELPHNNESSDDGVQFVTDKGMKTIEDSQDTLGVLKISEVVEGQAQVMDVMIDATKKQHEVNRVFRAKIDKISKGSGSGSGGGNITVKVSTIKEAKKIEGVHHHPKFKDIVEKLQLNADKCVYLCGDAGTGKTTLAEQVAKTMELPFGFLSCTEGMSEAHLLGRMLFNGDYVASEFVTLYENGGVFLLDEMDAMDSNVAVVINSALANGIISVPNRKDNPTAKRHENFFVIGAGNTWGTGQGSSLYSGRNKLDSATLDRFWGIEVKYDTKLEKMLANDDKAMIHALNELRKRVKSNGLNRIVGTRKFKDAGRCSANGKDVAYLMDHVTTGWTKEEINKVGVKDIVLESKSMAEGV